VTENSRLAQRIPTPCIGVCSTSISDNVCRGCKRFAHEVIDWNAYTPEQKRLIDQRLSLFLVQVMSDKFLITNQSLLEKQLQHQQIRYHAYKPPMVWLLDLLRAGAGQIENPAEFGFVVQSGYALYSLLQLREMIDQEFYQLSEAHYDRYVAPGLTLKESF
jgi:predicted Fe-S protein YdhL (DUF1289 family)